MMTLHWLYKTILSNDGSRSCYCLLMVMHLPTIFRLLSNEVLSLFWWWLYSWPFLVQHLNGCKMLSSSYGCSQVRWWLVDHWWLGARYTAYWLTVAFTHCTWFGFVETPSKGLTRPLMVVTDYELAILGILPVISHQKTCIRGCLPPNIKHQSWKHITHQNSHKSESVDITWLSTIKSIINY